MSLFNFPLNLTTFARTLPIQTFAWKLNDQMEISGQGSGDVLGVDLADPYWSSKVMLDSMTHDEAARIQAITEVLRPLRPFYFHDPRRPFPSYDPTGSILTGSGLTPQIHALNSSDYSLMRLRQLPGAYQIRRGDWLSFDFAAAPVHRAYHRVVTDTTIATGGGITDFFEVAPPLLPGAAVGTEVTLIRAAARCVIVANSFNEGQPKGTRNYGMAFEIRQIL